MWYSSVVWIMLDLTKMIQNWPMREKNRSENFLKLHLKMFVEEKIEEKIF